MADTATSFPLGSMYKQDADGYYTTNPENPNAERFYSDGRPVPTVSYSNAGTGQSFSGYTTPQNFQSIINAGSAQNESNVEQGLYNSGQIQTPKAYSAPTASSAPTSANPSSLTSSATYQQPTDLTAFQPSKSLPGYSYKYDVNDPSFLNMSAADRLNAFKTGQADPYAELNRVKQSYASNPSPDAHAWADQIRSVAGIQADDPFFGNGAAPTSQGSLNVNVNGQNTSQANVYNGTSYETADQLAKDLGLKFTVDPKTGIPSFNGTPIYTYNKDANGNIIVPTRMVANALGFQVNYDPQKGTVNIANTSTDQYSKDISGQGQTGTGNGQPGAGTGLPGAGMGQPGATDPLSQWTNFWNSAGAQQPSTMPIQSQFTPDWTNYYNQAHAQIDPLYQSQYQKLMDTQNANLTHMDESMNRRGIYTSGLAEAAANDLRAKTTDSVATLFNKQMSDIEKTAQTLNNDAYKQYSQGNQFALKYNQDQINNYMNQQKQIFSQWLGTQKLDLSQQQYALQAWDKMATMQLNQMKAVLPYEYQTANNSANNQTQLFKMLGYVQMPDGTIRPTEQTSNDARNYALNLAKTLGYMVNSDGSITPTEQAKQDQFNNQYKLMQLFGSDQQGNPTLDAQKLELEAKHWANQDANAAQKNQIDASLGTARLNQMAADATQRAQQFAMQMQNTQWGRQLQTANEVASQKFKEVQDLNNELMNIDPKTNPTIVQAITKQISDRMNEGNYITNGMLNLAHLSSAAIPNAPQNGGYTDTPR